MPRKKEPTQQIALSVQLIEQRIYLIRNKKVMISPDLAELYEVEPRSLMQAVKRNQSRFPDDFVFQLEKTEFETLRSQLGILETPVGRGKYPKYLPYAFTEQGIAMLSSVLNSEKAIQVNIAIMRAFVQMREILVNNEELARRIAELEKNTGSKLKKHDDQIRAIFEAIKKLIKATIPKTTEPTRQIGFVVKDDEEKK